ncbi:MAG: methyltransferase domain-containing protein [Oscillospiraceae bacterium]|nr:methyltransferase domain-containing protein [Oscillospiraceae bacterium]
MSAYEALAASYDRLTDDIAYRQTLAYIEQLLAEKGKQPQKVLDLACGTGTLSVLLAERGYQVLGADISEEMLAVAYEKTMELAENRPYFIHQSMQKLRLPYKMDCVVCCLDSLNYLTKPADCKKAIERVYASLEQGGIFIFDINSPEKLRGLDGQVFLDEDDDVYCVWRAEFDEGTNICSYGMDIFQRHGPVWTRSAEEHLEYAYTVEQLLGYLRGAGFTEISVYGDRSLLPPAEGEQRIYFAACKE